MFDAPPPSPPPVPPSPPGSYADVILPRRLRRAFTYLIPAELRGRVRVGRQVVVPFGTQALHGLVIGLRTQPPVDAPGHALKAIRSLAEGAAHPDLEADQLELSRWVAERYAASWGQCVTLVLPPSGAKPPRVRRRYVITEQGLAHISSDGALGKTERMLLERVRCRPKGLSPAVLMKGAGRDAARSLRELMDKGLIHLSEESVVAITGRVRKGSVAPARPPSSLELSGAIQPGTPAVAEAWPTTIRQALADGSSTPLVLQGIRETRLWCLAQAIQETMRRGRRALVVTGEVERAIRLRDLMSGLGVETILLHGGLSLQERSRAWQAAQSGTGDVLIGTRLAVFAPLRHLGLIWVDGEEDPSLKEEQSPRYHAREVARRRAVCGDAVLVLASGHPSMETWLEVERGAMVPVLYQDVAAAPSVELIDLKPFPFGTLVTPRLCDGLRDALRRHELAVLYLNRKGYASVLHCRDCGTMPQCSACSVALTFHKGGQRLRCHYCGRTKPLPEACGQCRSARLEPVGSGTEHVEETVRRLFPQARVGRMDSETIRRPAQLHALTRLLQAGEIDILIGTQMLFRLPIPVQAALVGVPDADAGLHVSDFRSAERTYHGLLDAVELARPAGDGGGVLVQTRFPGHHVMGSVATGDPSVFLQQERSFRELLQYPPFTHLIRLDVSGTIESVVGRAAQRWADLLRAAPAAEQVAILGPSPAPKLLARGRYCWQILVKSASLEAGRDVVTHSLGRLEREQRRGNLRFDVDVDPISMA